MEQLKCKLQKLQKSGNNLIGWVKMESTYLYDDQKDVNMYIWGSEHVRMNMRNQGEALDIKYLGQLFGDSKSEKNQLTGCVINTWENKFYGLRFWGHQ